VAADVARRGDDVLQVRRAVLARRRATAISWMSPCATLAAMSVEKRRRPAASLRFTIGSRPGSKIGISPRFSRSIFFASRSRQKTLLPASARQAPVTRPT
jgi:hypothetical protein